MVVYDLTISELDQMATDLFEKINPVKASAADSKEHWESRSGQDLKLPSDFQTLLDDTLLAFGPETMCAALISARINTILLSTVGAAKQTMEQVEDASKLRDRMARYRLVHLCLEQVITMQRPNDLAYNHVRCIADGILWYGHETELEAMLVVERTTGVIENDTVRIPPIMLMFYHSRTLAGRKSDMYGIVTNSYKWHFTRMTSGGQYFQTILDWMNTQERQLIINQIRDIVYQAGLLRNHSMAPILSVSFISDCEVWPDKHASEKLNDDDD